MSFRKISGSIDCTDTISSCWPSAGRAIVAPASRNPSPGSVGKAMLSLSAASTVGLEPVALVDRGGSRFLRFFCFLWVFTTLVGLQGATIMVKGTIIPRNGLKHMAAIVDGLVGGFK